MTKQPNRIQVRETERYWGDLEGPLTEIITSLQNKLDEGWEGIQTDYTEYDNYTVPFLYKYREEYDKEYEKRMKQLEKEKEIKLRAKEKRRQQYEALRKEFGEVLE
jgi:hypothetical protein